MSQSRIWQLHAHEIAPGLFQNVGKKRWVELFRAIGVTDPVVSVTVTEDSDGPYWGWLASGETTPTMIWRSKLQFEMQFPYGVEREVELGRGVVLHLTVAKTEVALIA